MIKHRLIRTTAVLLLVLLPFGVFAGGKKEEPVKDSTVEKTSETQAPAGERVPLGAVAENTVASVNGTVITAATLDGQLTAIIQQYASQGMNLQQQQIAELRKNILENLIDQELLYQDAEKNSYTVPDEDVTVQLEAIKAQFPDEATYKSVLQSQGVTEAEIVLDIRKSLIIEKYVDDKFGKDVTVSDSDSRAFYDDNGQYFTKPEQIRASHILVQVAQDADEATKKDALERIEAIRTRVENGEEFSELARTTSEGPSSTNGGDLGFFGRGQMVKPFEDAAFKLEVGEVSGIVETQFGYHIIRLTAKNPEETVAYEDVKTQIDDHLEQLKMADLLKNYIAQIKPYATIERFVD